MQAFLTPVQLGCYQLPNRVVMAGRSRMKAIDYCPQPSMETYYAQRASAGLIVSEPTLVAQPDIALPSCPGLFTQSHVEAWRKITQAVHQAGGKIFVQLWHGANLDYLYDIQPELSDAFPLDFSEEANSLQRTAVVQQFRKAAQRAIAAEFDGIEIHGALGRLTRQISSYQVIAEHLLLEGVVADNTDLLIELVEVISAIWDSDRLGVFLCPERAFCEYGDTDPEATFYSILEAIGYIQTAYLHLCEARMGCSVWAEATMPFIEICRPVCGGTILTDAKESLDLGLHLLEEKKADLISFRQRFADNGNLVSYISSLS